MQLDRKSRIRQAWQHPLGHDLLVLLAGQKGLGEAWFQRRFVAGRTLASLDKLAGPEFVDMLIEVVNANPMHAEEAGGTGCDEPAWWKQGVGYRVYLPSFMDSDHDGVGDLTGVLQRLPYLARLGVDVVWLSSLQTAPGAAPLEDARAIQPDYGDMDDMTALLEAIHARDMRVVLELDAARGPAELERAVSHWRAAGVDGFCLTSLNLLGKEGLPGHGIGRLRRMVCGPVVHARLRELAEAARQAGPVFLAGEVPFVSPGMMRLFCAPERGELDLLLSNDGAWRQLGPERPRPLDLFETKQRYLRWLGAGGGVCWAPVALQSALSPRVVSRVGASGVYRTTLAKMLATVTFTLRGTPLLYQGEELGLANTRFANAAELRDEAALAAYNTARGTLGEREALELAEALTADHARVPFPWSAGPAGGFTGAVPWLRAIDGIEHLNAAAQMGDASSVWAFFQRLIALRHDSPALVYGAVEPVFARSRKTFCFFRILDGEKWYVELNLTAGEVARPGRILKSMQIELSNYGAPGKTLRPFEANLYRCE